MITIAVPANSIEWDKGRALLLEYATSRDFDCAMGNVKEEARQLHLRYGQPEGIFLLAQKNGEAAGCVAFRLFAEGACEMKRLYVRPSFRGMNIGRRLIEAIIDNSRKAGYEKLLLDTLPDMAEAKHLYGQFGFSRIAAYNNNPAKGVQHFELKL